MPSKEIYLDNSATSPLFPEVWQKMQQLGQEDYGNPSSLHAKGVRAKRYLNRSREIIANVLAVKPEEIYFTSGGTESNNLALFGCARQHKKRGRHLITTAIEHPSILEPLRYLEENEGFQVTYLSPDSKGLISAEQVLQALRDDTTLVAIMHVNNEMGSRLPVEKIAQAVKEKNNRVHFHLDAVQSYARLDIKPKQYGIDSLSISGHKIHGPKGVGALYLSEQSHITPLLFGGGQEQALRPGTENLLGIVGLATAVERTLPLVKKNWEQLKKIKENAVSKVLSALPEAIYNGPEPGTDDVPYIISFCFPGLKGEVLVHALEEENIFVSTGSACHSRHPEPSHVLLAMGLPRKAVEGAVRLSLSPDSREEDVAYAVETLVEKVKELTHFLARR